MADDDISPTQPVPISRPVSHPPDEKRRHKEKAPDHPNNEDPEASETKKPKEDHRGDWIDEYV